MNQDLLYSLDPHIISILFKLKKEIDILNTFNMLTEDVNKVIAGTFKEYLLENNFPEKEVDDLLAMEDFEKADPKFKPFLQNITLLNKIDANTKDLLKAYYDNLLVALSVEEKAELDKYLQENAELIEQKNSLVKNGLSMMKKVLEDSGVGSIEELEKKVGSGTESEQVNSVPVNNPAINLGGVNTMDQQEPSTNTIPEGSVVDMALDKATEILQTQVFDQVEPVLVPPVETPIQQPPVIEPITEAPVEIPSPPAPPVNEMVMPVVESVIPESTTSNEIQFTPLTEVPETTAEVQAPVEPIAPSPVLDNKLPELPTSAAAKLDGLGIDLNEGTENTKQ